MKLRREIDLLKKQIELLKHEIELLKKESKAQSERTGSSKAGARELEPLQGTWNIDSMEMGGKSLPKELMNGYKFIFAGNKLTWEGAIGMNSRGGKITAIDGAIPCDLKIEASKEPKQIDITFHLKQGDRTVLGIYEIKGDTLKVCYLSNSSSRRPADFSVKDDRNIAHIILTRAKK